MTDQETKALYIAKKCIAAGMTVAGAAGVLINIQHESVFSSINVEDRYHSDTKKSDEYYTQMVDTNPSYDFETDNGGRYGYGLCQWTYPTRKREMRQYHKSRGVSIGDRDTQIEFMIMEMKRDFRDVWTACTSSQSAYNCAYLFCKKFENPANAEMQSTSRANGAQRWLDFLNAHMDDQTPQPEPTPAPAPTPDTDDDGMPIPVTFPPRTIDHHCTGFPEIKLLQALLLCHGYNVLVDGIWSNSLTEKLKAYQAANGLSPDAVAGKMTWAKLMEL